jgi:hypothetical protein
VCEEFDSLSMPADPTLHAGECALKAQAAMQRVLASRGANTRCGRDLAGRMRDHGLVDIRADGRMAMWQGGSPGARLYRANFEQLRVHCCSSICSPRRNWTKTSPGSTTRERCCRRRSCGGVWAPT